MEEDGVSAQFYDNLIEAALSVPDESAGLALLRKYIDVTGNACRQFSPEDPFRIASIANIEKYASALLQHLAHHWVLYIQDREYQRSNKIYDWMKMNYPAAELRGIKT
jgi:hypothetical protein